MHNRYFLKSKMVFKLIVTDDDGAETVHLLPAKYEVCHRCDGRGTHVNPNVDGNGITPEEFAEDPDFAESYFAGVYDIACEKCRGERVVPEPLTRNLPPAAAAAYRAYCDECLDEADYQAECAAERRAGG